jgi:uncharacterized protein (TIGR03437 family)
LSFQIEFGTMQGAVVYDGLAPGAVGLYQFDVVVPAVASSDTVPLKAFLGGVSVPQTLYVAIQ